MSYPFLIQGNNVVVVIDNKPHTISKTHITYQKVVDAIKASDWDLVKEAIEPKKVVLNYGQGNVSIQGETLFWKSKELHTTLAVKMIDMLREGFPIEPMVKFMDNLYQNPSKRAVDELYGFLEKGNLPITPDGHFLAYKKVRGNYFDVHSGTMDNSIGKIVEMERYNVDDNKDNTCSSGLHFCSKEYLTSFSGERTVIVKINPADVVSIPSDYNATKGRACRYEVVGELDVSPEEAFNQSVQTMSNSKDLKTGSSEFYCGYTDGFRGNNYGGSTQDYDEGYGKGSVDREDGNAERYRYVPKVQAGAWPFAKN
jgi:hypothetical protein